MPYVPQVSRWTLILEGCIEGGPESTRYIRQAGIRELTVIEWDGWDFEVDDTALRGIVSHVLRSVGKSYP
jgi:hypothetical protein